MKKFLFNSLVVIILCSSQANAVYIWQQHISPVSLLRDRGTGFVIGDNLYFGTGYQNGATLANSDFWEYNTNTGVWTQIASITGSRHGASGFSFNGKGYVCLGHQHSGAVYYNDLKEYDPVMNLWTNKSSFPLSGRYGASSFVINNKVYIVGGNSGSGSGPYSNAVHAYDFNTNTWAQCSSYPGTLAYYRTSFQIGNYGYVGTGVSLNSGVYNYYSDFYRYDPATDVWSSIPQYPGGMWAGMTSVVYQQKAFVGLGTAANQIPNSEFYIFDPAVGSWSSGPTFTPGSLRAHGVGLSTSSRAFIGTGLLAGVSLDDLWELTETLSLNESVQENYSIFINDGIITVSGEVHPEGKLELFNLSGQSISISKGGQNLDASSFSDGIYLVRYSIANKIIASSKIFVH